MSCHAHVVAELGSVAGFLRKRSTLGAGARNAASEIATRLLASIADMVARLPELTTAGANELLHAVQTSGFDDQQQAQLAGAIDQRLASGVAAVAKQKKKPQVLHTVHMWLSQRDWDMLRSTRTSLQSKIQAIVHRLSARCGLTNPHERTCGWIVAILVLCHFPEFPTYKSIFAILNDVKQSFDAAARPYPFSHWVEFPASPAQLEKDRFEYSYDADDPPVTQEIERLQVVALHHVPLRKNSKLLTGEAAQQETAATSGFPHAGNLTALLGALCQAAPSVGPGLRQSRDPHIVFTPSKSTSPMTVQRAAESPPIDGHAAMQAHLSSLLGSFTPKGSLHKPATLSQSALPVKDASAEGSASWHDGDDEVDDMLGNDCEDMPKEDAAPELASMAPLSGPPAVDTTSPCSGDSTNNMVAVSVNAFEQAAIDAFQARAQQKLNAKAKAAASSIKRPAAAAASTPAKKAHKKPRSDAPPCPCSGASPVLYKCGRIYTTDKGHFRVVRQLGDNNTMRRVCYKGGSVPEATSWNKCLQLIDEYHAEHFTCNGEAH